MAAVTPRVFNIPASAPFLPALIDALVNDKLGLDFPKAGDPLALAQATLYLPTRRACRLARDIFLDTYKHDAAILPRIVALGDIDEDEIAFAEAATGELAAAALALPRAIEPLERRLTLAQLIATWATRITPEKGAPLIANTPEAAIALADALARLMDDMITRQVQWEKLDGLVPEDLDQYWQETLGFLKFVHPAWQSILKEKSAIESAERRDKLIDAEARRLAGVNAPVIAAGSTGSMPATAKLLTEIARLPRGAVVLPGLDTDLDEASWLSIAGNDEDKTHDGAPAAGHPQFAMQALLARIGIAREAVHNLAPPAAHGRELLASEALRPAATTEHWQARLASAAFNAAADKAMTGVTVIEAANPEEEALAIAVALRQAVTEPGKTAALVTADRSLARRVVAALERWEVAVEDSGSGALADTTAGTFARLAAEVTLGGLEPVPLLALLKHPLLRLGAGENAHARAISALERAVLRGPRPRAASQGLKHALASFRATRDRLHRNDPRKLIAEADLDAAEALVDKLTAALDPLETLNSGTRKLGELAAAHGKVIENLARDGASIAAFAGTDGQQLKYAFERIAASEAAKTLEIATKDFPDILHALLSSRHERRPESARPRVRIFGLLEARLQNADRLVLGGLNEGVWPPETRSDPWLSRPMRLQLGLNLPELRVGLSAHDFAQGLGAPEVVVTRAARQAGAPTVSSRFVQRLAAIAGETRWKAALARGENYLVWARLLDQPAEVKAAPRPEPNPPLETRPRQLSVTDIENWLRDPYTIYAKHVLRLHPFEAVDTTPGAADRGSAMHDAIGEFTKAFATALPDDIERQLIAAGEKSFAPLGDFPEARAFWWPRFLRIARWFAGFERERRAAIAALYAEISGELPIALGPSVFTLTARADRIEKRTDGSYVIVDYKTGAPPTEPQVRTGLSPQLTLEGAILRGGGFKQKGIDPGSLAEMLYVRLKGGEPPGEPKPIKFKEGTPDTQADRALAKLTEIARKFLVGGEAYRSLVHPMWQRHYGDYDHLARVKEWAASGGESEAEWIPPS